MGGRERIPQTKIDLIKYATELALIQQPPFTF